MSIRLTWTGALSVAVSMLAIAASMRMAAFLFDRIEVGHRACRVRSCLPSGSRRRHAAGLRTAMVLPAPGWPARATLRMLFGAVGHEAVSPVVWVEEGRHGCPRCGSAAIRAGARRAVMAGAGVAAGRARLPQRRAAGQCGAVRRHAGNDRPRVGCRSPHPHTEHRHGYLAPRHRALGRRPQVRPGQARARRRAACSRTRRYGFNSRFGDEKGTNPEELIAAAHAGCFTMALSAKLTEAGHPPASLDTARRRRPVDGRRPDHLSRSA